MQGAHDVVDTPVVAEMNDLGARGLEFTPPLISFAKPLHNSAPDTHQAQDP